MSWTSSYDDSGFDAAIYALEKVGAEVSVHSYGEMHRDYDEYHLGCALVKINSTEYVFTEVFHEAIISEYGDGDYTPMSFTIQAL